MEPVLGSSTTRRGGHTMLRSARYTSIFFAAALLVAGACGPATTPGASGSAGASPTASAGGAAGTLVWYSDLSDLISLDPGVVYEFSGTLLAHNTYETLVKFEGADLARSEEHTSELQSPCNLVCRLLLEKNKSE